MQKLDSPEFVEKDKCFSRKLMEVPHVLAGMKPSGSVIYVISEHGRDFLFEI